MTPGWPAASLAYAPVRFAVTLGLRQPGLPAFPAGRFAAGDPDARQESSASANSRALKVSRSSSFSPTPMK